jgi:hypothetical protein
LPGQAVSGSGNVDQIFGSLSSTSDADVYRILISDPELFSAETFSPIDTQLFLFDVTGFGIVADDDNSISRDAGFPLGDPLLGSLVAGEYLLAVSGFDLDPVSAGLEIFPDPAKDDFGVVGATGPGASGPFDAWVQGDPTVVPEPCTALLVGFGLAGLALRRQATVA